MIGSIDLSWTINKEQPHYLSIYGSDGTILVGWKESKYRRTKDADWTVFGRGYDKLQAFCRQIDNFSRAIRGEEPLVVTPQDAMASVEVIEAGYEALRQSHWHPVQALARQRPLRAGGRPRRKRGRPMTARVHPTAIIEEGVVLGRGTAVWDNVHVRRDARLGDECIVGEKTYIAYGVRIGNRVKINAMVYICAGVTIEDGVMIAAGTVFTNDRFPRATTPDLAELRSSDPDEHTRQTLVREGATIGAHCTIGCDLVIGRFAMIGMGSVVTRSVPDFHLALGSPARSVGCVCRCGQLVARFPSDGPADHEEATCRECGRRYAIRGGVVSENV